MRMTHGKSGERENTHLGNGRGSKDENLIVAPREKEKWNFGNRHGVWKRANGTAVSRSGPLPAILRSLPIMFHWISDFLLSR